MPSPDPDREFLPGDRNYPVERRVVPDEPPPAPRRTYPKSLLIMGAVLVAALLVGGFVWLRVFLGDPAARSDVAPEPLTTLTPRSGTPMPLQTVDVGQRVPIQGLYGQGSFMVVRHEWSAEGDLPTSLGRQYLNVEVRYDSAEGSLFIKPDFFAAYDVNKNEYLSTIGSGKDPIQPQELQAGQSATGWVSVEVPPGRTFFVVSDEGINALVMVDIPGP
ncbi:hypothetical protein [Granulicoccus sp. GXG6511]|uniref:hypothetical protein n=1 Tax=Granulicoccus sp. GXG6511 TaxID=3381351 RepID=UPI003D7EE64A